MRNLKLAFRTLLKTPFVTAIAILSLALGIGANAAIFSLFDQMLLRPLPVREPERLVNLSAPGPKPGSQSCNQAGDCETVFSYPMFRDLERQQASFTGLAAHRGFSANLAFRRQTLNGEGMMVSGSYFPTLGLQPALGRLLSPADDQTIGGHFVAVLSHSFWTTQLGADRAVIGQAIVVNGQQMTIVGVAPRGFEGTTIGTRPRVFVPISMRGLMSPGFRGFENRRSYWIYVFGRLKPAVSVEQARLALNTIYKPIINDVEAPLQEQLSEQTMARFRARTILMEPGPRGQSSIHEDTRTPMLLLLAITGIVLLIACANIANLLLARAATREMEMAVRLSMGATRGQLTRQLLVESLVLAILGGVVSLGFAYWTLKGIAALLPPEALVDMPVFHLNGTAVVFAAGVSVVTGMLFGLFPALHSTRPDLVTALRSNTSKASSAKTASRFRSSLVTAQIALSMALLVSAGLFIRSLANVSRVALGVKTENVVQFAISPELNGYTQPRMRALLARLEEELKAQPGVTGVTAGMVPLLSGNNWGSDVSVQGFKRDPDTDANARYNEVATDYFRTLGVPLIAGREFTTADDSGAPRVAIVNQAFAKKFGLGRDAVGKLMGNGATDSLTMTIVGLVQDAKYNSVKDTIPPQFFVPYRQADRVGGMTYYVRTAMAPEQVLRTIPPLVARLDPDLPVEELKTLPQQVRENVFFDRMISILSASFAVLATLLAAVGLYGVLAYTVAQRTREIGVRMALGADSARVRALVLRQVAVMTVIGAAIGIAGALGLGRAARSLLFELQGHDPVAIVTSVVLLALVALGAAYVPARRASRVDPMQALRYE